MSVTVLLEELEGQHITLWLEGEKLRYRGPKEVLTPELLAQLKGSKPEIIEALRVEDDISSPSDVLVIAREVLPPLTEADQVDLQELLQANKPPDRGRDPMAKHETDKAHFFSAPPDCTCDVCAPLPKYTRALTPTINEGVKA